MPTLYDILPGYLPMPTSAENDLAKYIARHRAQKGWWHNIDKYMVSLLKAYYGDAATRQNDFGFAWLPRLTGDHSYFGSWLDMVDGKLEGLVVMGQNPAVGSPNGKLERAGLARLQWLVVREMVETETVSFWQESPDTIDTEVFFFPAASHVEKEGTFTNTQRLLQWREKAVDPPGDARSELQFLVALGRKLKAKASDAPRDAALRALTWEYEDEDADEVLREMHGWKAEGRRRKAEGKGQTLRRAEIGRHHELWLLDLLRCLRRHQQSQRAGCEGPLRPWLGLCVAARPAHPLQPRVRAP